MTRKPIALGIALLVACAAAQAMTTVDLGPYSISYDETTSFGSLSSWFSSGSSYGFSFNLPVDAQVVSLGGVAVSNSIAIPSLTITPNAGWALSGAFSAFIGNVVFSEVGGASTSMSGTGDVSVNGGSAVTIGGALTAVPTVLLAGFVGGYYADTASLPVGGFSSLALSNASLSMSASGGSFASVIAQPQNKLEFSFTAVPVPEPQSYAMLLAGLGVVGLLARRRGTTPGSNT